VLIACKVTLQQAADPAEQPCRKQAAHVLKRVRQAACSVL